MLYIRLRPGRRTLPLTESSQLQDDQAPKAARRAPLAIVLACQNYTTHTKMSSGYGLTGGMLMWEEKCARVESEQSWNFQSTIGIARRQHADHTGSREQVPHDAFPSGRTC